MNSMLESIRKWADKHKALLLNLVYVTCLSIYIGLLSLLFYSLEKGPQEEANALEQKLMVDCFEKVLKQASNTSVQGQRLDQTLYYSCIQIYRPEPDNWTWPNAALFTFSALTTLGCGTLTVESTYGRLFYVVYTAIGIPLTLLALANLGQFLRDMLLLAGFHGRRNIWVPFLRWWHMELPVSEEVTADQEEEKEEEPDMSEIDGKTILIGFIFYLSGGTIIVLIFGGGGLVHSVYAIYLSITSDVNPLLSANTIARIAALVYAAVGVALTTVALEAGSAQLKKLHAVGMEKPNPRAVRVWFGGKQTNVYSLLNALGQQTGVSPEKLRAMDFDQLVNGAVNKFEKRNDPKPPSQTHRQSNGVHHRPSTGSNQQPTVFTTKYDRVQHDIENQTDSLQYMDSGRSAAETDRSVQRNAGGGESRYDLYTELMHHEQHNWPYMHQIPPGTSPGRANLFALMQSTRV